MSETPATTDPTAHWWPFVDGVRAFVARRVPAQDVDDVAQEVMVRLHRGVASLQEAERAESWVYGVARRTVADYYRGRSVGGERVIEEALLLADFEGHTQQEVANELGLSLSGAKSRVQRARAMLGEHLRRCCEIELGADGEVVDFSRRERDG